MCFVNVFGLIIFIVIMIPNGLFFIFNKNGFYNNYKNKLVELFEQIGRYCCFGLMIFNIPYLYKGFWLKEGQTIYLIVNGLFVFLYLLFWIIYWKKDGIIKAILLSVLPSCIFIFSGVMEMYIPLIISSIVFSVCHIRISYMNTLLGKIEIQLTTIST